MICPKCGAELAADAKFCSVCGNAIPAEPAAPAEKDQRQKFKLDVNEIKNQLIATVKPVAKAVKKRLANRNVLLGIAIGVVAIVVLSIISAITAGNNGFVQTEQALRLEKTADGIRVIVDKKVLPDIIEDDTVVSHTTNLDGTVSALLTGKDVLYIVDGKDMERVAENVIEFTLSSSGKGLVYSQQDETDSSLWLTLYTVGSGKTANVCQNASNLHYVLSPDGKSVCYYAEVDGEEELMYFEDDKSITVTTKDADVHGLSDNGKYIYATCKNEDGDNFLYSFDTKGQEEALGQIGSELVYFNEEHTQVMFYHDGKTFISNKGKAAEKASSSRLNLVLAPNAATFTGHYSQTYPVSDLFDHVYTASDGESTGAWLIKKNANKSVKLVSRVSDVKLDASAEYLYYLYNGNELRVVQISDGKKANERYTKLAENVYHYVVTSDRSLVYFVSADLGNILSDSAGITLKSVDGEKGGRSRTIDSIGLLSLPSLNGDDVCYYLKDGDLYACTNGKKGSKVANDIDIIRSTASGTVYFEGGDYLYATTGSKKPTELLDNLTAIVDE